MATNPTWQAPATYNGPAYGYDPSWFTGPTLTMGERLQQAQDEWRAKNPGAPYMPSPEELVPGISLVELFPGLVMSQEGAKAYDDLVTARNKKDQLNSVLTVAGLAALPFAAASFMAPGVGTLGAAETGVTSLAAPSGLSLGAAPAIDYAALSVPGLEGLGGASAIGAEAGIGTLGGMGFEAPSLMGSVAPELTAPLSTAGSQAAAAQLAMGGAPMGVFGDIPMVPDVGGPIASIPEHAFLPVAEVPTMATGWLGGLGGALGSALSGAGSKLADFATSPSGLATLVGAGLGAASGGNDTTATTQSKTDPRIDPYIYGDQGVLQNAQKLYQQNPTGINPTMQQGLDMQRSALTDPAYAQSYQNMRNLGNQLMTPGFMQQGLISPNVQAGGPGGLLGAQDRAKALIAKGQGLLG